ncbi:MAG: GNAT family N-acetyltransferase [Xanthomarina sp.]
MYQIKQILAEESYPIRQAVLRQGRPINECIFDGDLNENTFHLGLFTNSELIGVASFIKNKSHLFSEENQFQLRGMAVLKAFQNKGLGKLLLDEGENILLQKKADILWFHARETAVSFYKKRGFIIEGDSFIIPNVGKHYFMYKKLTS